MLFATLLLTISQVRAAPLTDEAAADCAVYAERETEFHCGDSGYFKKFGQPYCEQFSSETRPLLTAEGQIWIDQTRRCLRDHIERLPTTVSCQGVWQEARQQHLDCYRDTGFCRLPIQDRLRITRTASRELRNPVTFVGAVFYHLYCLRQ